jgi:hypothetical protein
MLDSPISPTSRMLFTFQYLLIEMAAVEERTARRTALSWGPTSVPRCCPPGSGMSASSAARCRAGAGGRSREGSADARSPLHGSGLEQERTARSLPEVAVRAHGWVGSRSAVGCGRMRRSERKRRMWREGSRKSTREGAGAAAGINPTRWDLEQKR